jgi:hypothetical protein
MDTDTNIHMTSDSGNPLTPQSPSSTNPYSIVVSNGSLLSVTSTDHTLFFALDHPLHLHHVLVSLDIIKNLIFVC